MSDNSTTFSKPEHCVSQANWSPMKFQCHFSIVFSFWERERECVCRNKIYVVLYKEISTLCRITISWEDGWDWPLHSINTTDYRIWKVGRKPSLRPHHPYVCTVGQKRLPSKSPRFVSMYQVTSLWWFLAFPMHPIWKIIDSKGSKVKYLTVFPVTKFIRTISNKRWVWRHVDPTLSIPMISFSILFFICLLSNSTIQSKKESCCSTTQP